MTQVCPAGDWNAPPGDLDRYRPAWLARRLDLSLVSAGRGTYGDIDYPMSSAQLARVRRGDRYGSDHQAVLFTVHDRATGVTLKGGTWNMLHDRDPVVVAAELLKLMDDHKLEFVCLQEATQYHRAVRATGTMLVAFDDARGVGETAIAVKATVTVSRTATHRLSRLGWPLRPDLWHAPVYTTTALLDGWLRVYSVHLPNHERGPWHAMAYRQAMRRLRRRLKRVLGSPGT